MPTPTNGAQPTVVELPAPKFPMLTRVISHALFPAEQGTPELLNARARHMLEALARDPQRQLEIVTAALQDAYRRGSDEPITWVIGKEHPLAPEMRIVRMFVDHDGIEVYSVPVDVKNGGGCARNLIPMSTVRFTEESMPISVFVEELTAAEEDSEDDGDDDDDDDDTEAGSAEGASAPAPGGPVTS